VRSDVATHVQVMQLPAMQGTLKRQHLMMW
jgi:hypothetical protein